MLRNFEKTNELHNTDQKIRSSFHQREEKKKLAILFILSDQKLN